MRAPLAVSDGLRVFLLLVAGLKWLNIDYLGIELINIFRIQMSFFRLPHSLRGGGPYGPSGPEAESQFLSADFCPLTSVIYPILDLKRLTELISISSNSAIFHLAAMPLALPATEVMIPISRSSLI